MAAMRNYREYPIEIGTNRSTGATVKWSPEAQKHHAALFGLSGVGKTTALLDILRQFVINGTGFCLLDPHGGFYNQLVEWLALRGYDKKRTIHLIDPAVEGWRVGFNPLLSKSGDYREIGDNIDAVIDGFSQAWGGEDIDRMPLYLRLFSAILYASSVKGLTLLEAMTLLPVSRGDYRDYVSTNLPDHIQEDAWEDIKRFNDRDFQDRFSSAFSRIYRFMRSYYVREMVGQTEDVIDFYRCMEEGDIVLINLSPRLGFTTEPAQTLGKLFINNMVAASMRREVDVSRPFHLVIDEAENYLSGDVPSLLTQCRKFGLHLTLSIQDLGQLLDNGDRVYRGVMGGCQTKFVFGAGAEDAEVLTKYVMPRGGYNLEEPIPSMIRPVNVGVEKTVLRNESENWAHADINMQGRADISVDTEGEGGGDTIGSTVTIPGEVLTTMYGREGDAIGSSVSTPGNTDISMDARNANWQRGHSEGVVTTNASGTVDARGGQQGRNETYKPVYKDLPTQHYSIEQQRHRHASAVADQRVGEVIVKMMRDEPQPVSIKPPLTLRKNQRRVSDFKQRVAIASEYTHPHDSVTDQISYRFKRLEALVNGRAMPPVIDGAATEVTVPAADDDEEFLE